MYFLKKNTAFCFFQVKMQNSLPSLENIVIDERNKTDLELEKLPQKQIRIENGVA